MYWVFSDFFGQPLLARRFSRASRVVRRGETCERHAMGPSYARRAPSLRVLGGRAHLCLVQAGFFTILTLSTNFVTK